MLSMNLPMTFMTLIRTCEDKGTRRSMIAADTIALGHTTLARLASLAARPVPRLAANGRTVCGPRGGIISTARHGFMQELLCP